MLKLRFRQVHLDFHTSEHIPAVGAGFDPDRFAETLKKAHVDSVTLFARCHHGWIYFDSKKFPERIHPSLKSRDLLRQQIEACHARGIRTPIYTTVQWDDYTARHHRDWLYEDTDGRLFPTRPLDAGFYRYCDVLHPAYRQFLKDHVAEMLDTLPVDGFFFDIVQPVPSLSPVWLEAMQDQGVDPEDESARVAFGRKVINEWKLEMTAFINAHPNAHDELTIFYNAGHIGPRHRATLDAYTHYEAESLPSGGWGYTHFPLVQRYARNLPRDTMGMTGKFHTSWGDFQSYKNEAALQYECFQMLALGAKCSIGDQLPPSGVLDEATYDLIGPVYASVEAKEPWCEDAKPISDIAVVTPEEFGSRQGTFVASSERQPAAAIGAVRMLTELQQQFDIVSTDMDLTPYRLVILPDKIPAGPEFAKKLQAYVEGGGKVIASYASGLNLDDSAFALDCLGVRLQGEADWSPDFIVPSDEFRAGLRDTAYVMYLKGLDVEPAPGTRVLAEVHRPYFNRTWRHFCSHSHTPSSGEPAGYPGIVESDHAIYFMHPIFTQYYENAPRWCRQLLKNAIDRLVPQSERLLNVGGPTSLLASINRQEAQNRLVLHLLHYVPERRGQRFDTIEDVIPIFDIPVDIRTDGKVASVRQVPDGAALDYVEENGRVRFTVPKVNGHTMIEVAL